jgi:predicted nucleic acid-binding protein
MDKIIISDTSCLITLTKIDKLDLLINSYVRLKINRKNLSTAS